ncbi:hypothetical protein [Paracoccus sp. BM15]|uniref:Uncharacterized protein n=1 Tax=Paracoccus tegillarcae TaxID=1529068 RepID=A0A2K9EL44_9RHOB|nr:hypothetical protein CUV01_18955 [Paracoccus tegillarcae]
MTLCLIQDPLPARLAGRVAAMHRISEAVAASDEDDAAPFSASFSKTWALFELRDALAMAEGLEAHHSSIAALLSRLGFTYKKKSLVASDGAAQV